MRPEGKTLTVGDVLQEGDLFDSFLLRRWVPTTRVGKVITEYDVVYVRPNKTKTESSIPTEADDEEFKNSVERAIGRVQAESRHDDGKFSVADIRLLMCELERLRQIERFFVAREKLEQRKSEDERHE